MNTQLAKKWSKTLRSGEFKQGRNKLHDIRTNTYCCLGVLCKLENKPLSGCYYPTYLPDSSLRTSFGYLHKNAIFGESLADFNDNGYTFDEIADIIDLLIYSKLISEL